MRDLRVMTWNMYMYGMQQGDPVDPSMNEHIKFIKKWNPDIIFIQEIDQNAFRTGYRDQLAILRQETDLKFSAFEAPPGVEVIGGSGILSRFPLTEIGKLSIPTFILPMPSSPSYIVMATAIVDGEPIKLYCNHWPPRPQRETTRRVAANLVLPLLIGDASLGRRVIFGGDLNAFVCAPEVQQLSTVLKDCLTVADSAPMRDGDCNIDHLLFRGSFHVKQCLVKSPKENGIILGDHSIIIADLSDGISRASKTWSEQNTGFLPTTTGDRIVFDIVSNGAKDPATVEFELRLIEGVWWKKVINMPDGEGNSFDIVSEGINSGNNSLWATQVKNGQQLKFSKKVVFGMQTILALGNLESLKPGALVIFQWLKD